MGIFGSELENILAHPAEGVREIIRGMSVMEGEASNDIRDELLTLFTLSISKTGR